MKNIIIYWIALQLIFIGVANGVFVAEISNKTYQCSREKVEMFETVALGIMVPLLYFQADEMIAFVGEYCDEQPSNNQPNQ